MLGLPFRLIRIDELERVNHGCITLPSDELRRLGIRGGVAELAALAAGGTSLLLRKIVVGRVTVAVARV